VSCRRGSGTDHLSRTGQIETGHLSRADRPSCHRAAGFPPVTGQTGQMICSHARAGGVWRGGDGDRAHVRARAHDLKTSVPCVPSGVENRSGDRANAGFRGTDCRFGSVPCLSRGAQEGAP
jgi:hypothetical protein